MPGGDARQRGPGHIGAPAVTDEKQLLRREAGFLQKALEQSAAALLHAVSAGDKAAVKAWIAAAAQHRVDLRLRQVHIGDIIELFPLLFKRLHRIQHGLVRRTGGQFCSALRRCVIAGKAGAGVDFSQRYLPALGGAGLTLGPDAGSVKIVANQAEKSCRHSNVAFYKRVKHVKGDGVKVRSFMANLFCQVHGRYGICGRNRTPAAKPSQMILMRSARQPCLSRRTCTVCQLSLASSHSQPDSPSRR